MDKLHILAFQLLFFIQIGSVFLNKTMDKLHILAFQLLFFIQKALQNIQNMLF